MNVISSTIQQYIEDSLITDGSISEEQLHKLKLSAKRNNKPILSLLLEQKLLPTNSLQGFGRCQQNPLRKSFACQDWPKGIEAFAQRYSRALYGGTAGEMQRRLVVAMLEADNVQAVDFLSNKIGRPLKVMLLAKKECVRYWDNINIYKI